jgi:hypothetical protein
MCAAASAARRQPYLLLFFFLSPFNDASAGVQCRGKAKPWPNLSCGELLHLFNHMDHHHHLLIHYQSPHHDRPPSIAGLAAATTTNQSTTISSPCWRSSTVLHEDNEALELTKHPTTNVDQDTQIGHSSIHSCISRAQQN